MGIQGNNTTYRESIETSVNDQCFLVNFIMGTYLGPDVYSDNPRCSALQRFAKVLPPYTSNNLGSSYVSISQLESLYYYVLRNAHPRLVLKPNILHLYFKGNLPKLDSGLLADHRQFTSFFPLNLHEQKSYSASYEIVKGIVVIDDPVMSYMNREVVEKFVCLSGMDDLKIDIKKCLSYQHRFMRGREEEEEQEQTRQANTGEAMAETISNGNGKVSTMFQETYKRRLRCSALPMPAVPSVLPLSKHHSGEEVIHRTFRSDGPSMMPVLTIPKVKECTPNESTILTGTATKGVAGPPIGVTDIGVSEDAYFFRVALPGVRRDFGQFSCEISSDGQVHIRGSTTGGKIIEKHSRVFKMKSQQLCAPGPFTLSFCLPGPVDPRLFSPNFRADGIFEGVVVKHEQ